jgi:hypothetical protein
MYKVAKVDGKELEKFLNSIGDITFLSVFPIEGLADYFTVVYAVKEKRTAPLLSREPRPTGDNPPAPPPNVTVKKGA